MEKTNNLEISKLEAAERQLDQAIRLFFQREDEVSVHTLASAAYQIITDICKHKKIEREVEDSIILEKFGVKKQVLDSLRKPQNFFKHADKDHTDTITLDPMLTALLLMSSANYLLLLREKESVECRVFRDWFFIKEKDSEHTSLEIKQWVNSLSSLPDTSDYESIYEFIKLTRSQEKTI